MGDEQRFFTGVLQSAFEGLGHTLDQLEDSMLQSGFPPERKHELTDAVQSIGVLLASRFLKKCRKFGKKCRRQIFHAPIDQVGCLLVVNV
jgi:hypothetical protein